MTADRVTLRMREVAEQLGVSTSTVKRWVATGQMRHVRVGGVVLVRPAALEAFLDDHEENQTSTARRRPGGGRRT